MALYNQAGPFIPRSDAGFRSFADNFAKLINANPGKYGLGPADATVIVGLARQYDEAYVAVQSSKSRTPAKIAWKDAVRASAEASLRVYARQIRANLAIDNQDRLALGLSVDNRSRAPIEAPRSAPLLNIVCAFAGSHQLRFADECTPNSRAKPRGVTNLWLAMAISDYGCPTPTDPNAATFIGAYTKQPAYVEHRVDDAGKTATYFGRWATARGLVGPWSLPRSMTIVAGGSAAPAQTRQHRTGGADSRVRAAA